MEEGKWWLTKWTRKSIADDYYIGQSRRNKCYVWKTKKRERKRKLDEEKSQQRTHTNTIRESRLPVDAVRMRCGAGGWGVVDGWSDASMDIDELARTGRFSSLFFVCLCFACCTTCWPCFIAVSTHILLLSCLIFPSNTDCLLKILFLELINKIIKARLTLFSPCQVFKFSCFCL